MIEGDDDGGLSWDEFESFFMKAGWGDTQSVQHNLSRSQVMSLGMRNSAFNQNIGGGSSNAIGTTIRPGDIYYVVERCESEFDDKYREVLRTTCGYGTVNHLSPGSSYRFRVYSVNAAGVMGPRSSTVLVHTLLEQPNPPSVLLKNILPRKVTLQWHPRKHGVSTRDKQFVEKMIGDWAGTHGEDDGGVSIEAAFAKYDQNRNGEIDASELELILKDLGVEVSDDRLSEAFGLLDKNGDGVISYDEFGEWWRREQVTYTVKRSEEIIAKVCPCFDLHSTKSEGPVGTITRTNEAGTFYTKEDAEQMKFTTKRPSSALNGRPGAMETIPEDSGREDQSYHSVTSRQKRPASTSRYRINSSDVTHKTVTKQYVGSFMAKEVPTRQVGVPVVSYRGSKSRCEIAGLTPNRLYHFRLRYVGSRSNSMLSIPLVCMTAPLPSFAPVMIELSSTLVRVKWYPPEFGAYKFIVQLRLHDKKGNNPGNKESARKQITGVIGMEMEDGWTGVYNSQENIFTTAVLLTDTTYEIRVISVNCQGTMSVPSKELVFTTLHRNVNDMNNNRELTPRNANSTFTIECTGDICVGDTILMTERIYLKDKYTQVGSAVGFKGGGGGGHIPSSKQNSQSQKQLSQKSLLNTSSIVSINGESISVTATRGTYIGERTIAAFVSKDNYRTIRDYCETNQISPQDAKKFGKIRQFWLEVMWQKSSNDQSKKYEVKIGEVLKRHQLHLEQFEVYRTGWKQENMRKSLNEEFNILKECFVQTECI